VLLVYLVGVGAIGWVLGRVAPALGPAVFALLVGAAVRTLGWFPSKLESVAGAAGTLILRLSIVALGFSVSIADVATVARSSLLVMLGTVAVGLAGIWLLGRWLGVGAQLRGLITVGTSVCGASAIAAVAPVLEADSVEIGYAISVIFLFNVAAVIVFPAVGHLFGFSHGFFAVWAGTAINDTSSVLAAGLSFGAGTAATAAIVKLSRTVMILPITLGLALIAGRRDGAQPHGWWLAVRRGLPWFILAFIAATIVHTIGLVSADNSRNASTVASYGTIVALAAIGLSLDVHALRLAGSRPLILGLLGWILLAVTSLGLQALTHALS
jgi:uncharacterized integral membrane protein (TIGR00698 family)